MERKFETIVDGYGRDLTTPLSHENRKQWMRDNFKKISFLMYVYIRIEGSPSLHKVPLDKVRAWYKEENNIF